MSDSEAERAGYRKIEEGISEVAQAVGMEGILIDWVVLCAIQFLDGEGQSMTHTGYMIPEDSSTPHYRIMGLVDFVQAKLRKESIEDEEPG